MINKYGKDRKTEYKGICKHNIEFRDTFRGCITECNICNNKGKIIGYNQADLNEVV